jgi:hypothetical protein
LRIFNAVTLFSLICLHIPALAPAQVLAQVREPDAAPARVSAQAETTVYCLFLAK